jgi:hypothetical protein
MFSKQADVRNIFLISDKLLKQRAITVRNQWPRVRRRLKSEVLIKSRAVAVCAKLKSTALHLFQVTKERTKRTCYLCGDIYGSEKISVLLTTLVNTMHIKIAKLITMVHEVRQHDAEHRT